MAVPVNKAHIVDVEEAILVAISSDPVESLANTMRNLSADDDSPSANFDGGKSLLEALECAVCMEYMVPPIGMCVNGHNQCSKCQPDLDCCPTCRGAFIPTRNIAMETIAQGLSYPCQNRSAGCSEMYPLGLINEHQTVCLWRLYRCMLGEEGICQWKGRRHEIVNHAREVHPGCTKVDQKFTLMFVEFESATSAYVVQVLGELFVLHHRYEGERFYAVMQYLGPSENAARYSYDVEFKTQANEFPSVLFRNRVVPDSNSPNEVIKSGRCVSLGYDVLINFIKDTELLVNVQINRNPSCD